MLLRNIITKATYRILFVRLMKIAQAACSPVVLGSKGVYKGQTSKTRTCVPTLKYPAAVSFTAVTCHAGRGNI